MGNIYYRKGLSYTLLNQPPSDLKSPAQKIVRLPKQKEHLQSGNSRSHFQESGGRSHGPKSGLLQPSFSGQKEKWQVPAYNRLVQAQSTHRAGEIQDGDTRSIRESILPGDWAVSIDLKDAYLHIKIHPRSCLLYTSPSPRDLSTSRMPSSA